MGIYSYLFPGDEGALADIFWNTNNSSANSSTTPAKSYSIDTSNSNVEGEAIVIIVSTANVSAGTKVYYSLSGGGISSSDLSDGKLSGFGIVGLDGKFSFATKLADDLTTEGSETLEIKLYAYSDFSGQLGSTAYAVIKDSSLAPTKNSFGTPITYTISPSVATISEGENLSTTVKTTGVATGTILYYTLSGTGIDAADFSTGALKGSGTVGNDGKFSLSHTLANDQTPEEKEIIRIKLFNDSSLTSQVGSTASVVVADSSWTTAKNNSYFASTPIRHSYPGRTTGEFKNTYAFAALQRDGSVVTWGDYSYGGDSSKVSNELTGSVSQIFSTDTAFAALKSDGSVVTWGDYKYGGDSSSVRSRLSSGVSQIFSTKYSFAALKNDGSVVSWGGSLSGGNSSSVASKLTGGITQIFSTSGAFAALKSDGSVVTWGSSYDGGDSSSVASSINSGIVDIFTNQNAFAALKTDGSVITWGASSSGGDSSAVARQLLSGVIHIFSTKSAFAALKSDGSVVTWGSNGYGSFGGDSSAVASKLASGVSKIFSTDDAFAALKSDGSVVTWGSSLSGGDSSSISSLIKGDVINIFPAASAFAAVKIDGSVVTWGDSYSGGDSSSVATKLSSGVNNIVSSYGAFAALKADGSVVTWGISSQGGDSSLADGDLTSNVTNIYSTYSAFAALKSDGSVITWGNANNGGVKDLKVVDRLNSKVVGLVTPFTNDIFVPTYVISSSSSSINEGESLSISLTTTGIATGSAFYIGVSGAGIDAEDFYSYYDKGFIDSNGRVSFSLDSKKDNLTEGLELLNIKLFSDSGLLTQVGNAKSIAINDTSLTWVKPTFLIAPSSASISEGQTLTTTIKTTGIDVGYRLYYRLTGVSASDLSSGTLTGSGVVGDDGTFSFAHTLANDLTTESDELLGIQLSQWPDSFWDESKVFASTSIAIRDTSTTPISYVITPSAATINEGATLTTTVTTTGVAQGTTLYYSLTGTGINAADFTAGALTGSGTVGIDGKINFSHTLANDLITEGLETLEIKLFSDADRTVQVGATASVAIADTSLIVAPTPKSDYLPTLSQGTSNETIAVSFDHSGGVQVLRSQAGSSLSNIIRSDINIEKKQLVDKTGVLLNSSQLDFTLNLAKQKDKDNTYFYASSANAYVDLSLVGSDLAITSGKALAYYVGDSANGYKAFTYDPIKKEGARFFDTNGDGIADYASLRFVDGGYGDKDGVKNGAIVDPGAAAAASISASLSSSGQSLLVKDANKGDAKVAVNLKASLRSRAATANEIGYIVLNDGDAVTFSTLTDRAQVLFSNLQSGDVPDLNSFSFQRQLSLVNGQSLRLFETSNTTLAALAAGKASIEALGSSFQWLTSTVTAGVASYNSTSGLNFTLELSGAALGLGQLLAQEQANAPVLDFTGMGGKTLSASYVLAREASYSSSLSFYRVQDVLGTVKDTTTGLSYRPGDTDYLNVAKTNMVSSLSNLAVANLQTGSGSLSLNETTYLAPMAVLNGGETYFAFAAANSDGLAHFRSLGDNTIGLEDIRGGGDLDFDDLIFSITPTQLV
ncbi:hypothetical protein KBY58_05335 [Cyanobium sp. HWJ4-Hawea]|uniref:DUF4114 domain-containing protein n=1 Tax=Cyanobium sp. HWJ4-Hawea TaxID=2823713 RepID=UPI0020CD2351|nr:DUF4114 domain-containing protein [Cyanobium sp. HWJ4-Hawea]MCP9808850.1 hypothetical protein [Cyanobium sp. HWJ4-Hawea]